MARKSRKEQDDELWRAWKNSPGDETLVPLMENFQGAVNRVVNTYRAAPVPSSAVEGVAQRELLKAFNTYNPDKGASLNTPANWYLKKVHGFVGQHQNLALIPDHRIRKIGEYKDMRSRLTEKFGYTPDAVTLAEHLGPKWSVREVSRMETELRADWIAANSLEPDHLDIDETGRERELMRHIAHELTPQQRTVYEYTLGVNGKKKLKAGSIAKKMKISPSKVSRIRNQIRDKIEEYGF